MPLYDYVCEKCGRKAETYVTASDRDHEFHCKECVSKGLAAKMVRQMPAPNVRVPGTLLEQDAKIKGQLAARAAAHEQTTAGKEQVYDVAKRRGMV